MATRPVEIGPTGRQTATNIERIRTLLGISQRQLAERLTDLGRPIPSTALSKIERGDRRCDVDDLAALAAALGVSPTTLLLPPVADDTTTTVTGAGEVTARHAWDWADGIHPLLPREDDTALDHATRTRPEGRRADHLVTKGGNLPGPNPLGHLTKTELIHLLDDLKEALLDG
ncbi:helix-turn-helix transcriptional regulator [Streptomyces sp. CNQ-509]|uniref:helix-turn-helix domain-containing protein n=1 Tax=Streptomyces sp. CNQ-509 TaxID=444103 RepID=UPI00099D3A2C